MNNKNIEIILNNTNEEIQYYKENLNGLFKSKPYCFIKVKCYDEIRDVLLYAKSIGKGVSLRNSGHSNCLFGELEDSVNIDLSGLNKMDEIDIQSKTVKVQTGVKFINFYKETTKVGLACPGGGCGDVSIGGLLIGGGSNYLAPSYGLTVDNVICMNVMVADGTILQCSPNENRDLFFAMRGSGHGMAILLDATLHLHQIEPLLYHIAVRLDYKYLTDNLLIIDEFSKTMDTRTYLSVDCRKSFKIATVSKKPVQHSTRMVYFLNGPPKQGEIEFNQLLSKLKGVEQQDISMGTDSKLHEKSFYSILTQFKFESDIKSRSFSKCRISNGFSQLAVDSISKILESIPNSLNDMTVPDPYSTFSCMIYYHGGKSNRISPDSCAYAHRLSKWSVTFQATYLEKENDNYLSQNWKSVISENIPNIGQFIYQNYPDYDETLKIRSNLSNDPNFYNDNKNKHPYFEHQYQKLYNIKLKYDPNNFFSNHPQSIIINNKQ